MSEREEMPSEDRLRDLLVGRTVVSAEVADTRPPDGYSTGPTGTLMLSDGATLKVWGNDGGCACDAGCYPLAHLASAEGVITNVEVEENPADDTLRACRICGGRTWECIHPDGWYRVFVVTEAAGRSLVASFEGSDGNGYYGTGWWLMVELGQDA